MRRIATCVALQVAALLLAAALVPGCTNVTQMQQQYQSGDERQLGRLLEIAARPEYPYATRRKAARSLGEIGDARAVPVLAQLLYEFDQRVTLKQEALAALAKLGDPRAVPAIGRMLDLQLFESSGDLRVAAMETLGALGGQESAIILLNALRYYDAMLQRREQMAYRGVFSGEEMVAYPYGSPYGPAARPDSSGMGMPGPPRVGAFGDESGLGPVNMFGLSTDMPQEKMDHLRPEQAVARAALVRVGPAALPAIERLLAETETTRSLQRELVQIALEIRGAADAAAVPDAAPTAVPGAAPGAAPPAPPAPPDSAAAGAPPVPSAD